MWKHLQGLSPSPKEPPAAAADPMECSGSHFATTDSTRAKQLRIGLSFIMAVVTELLVSPEDLILPSITLGPQVFTVKKLQLLSTGSTEVLSCTKNSILKSPRLRGN